MLRISIASAGLMVAIACGKPVASTPAAGPTEAVRAQAPSAEGSARAASAELVVTSLGETEARLILAEIFRLAGYRILYDVELSSGGETLAVDGFDPDRRVGYEYVAPREQETAPAAARVAKGDAALLVIGPSSREELAAAARAFIEAVGNAQPSAADAE